MSSRTRLSRFVFKKRFLAFRFMQIVTNTFEGLEHAETRVVFMFTGERERERERERGGGVIW
jgi:hypothetical protein